MVVVYLHLKLFGFINWNWYASPTPHTRMHTSIRMFYVITCNIKANPLIHTVHFLGILLSSWNKNGTFKQLLIGNLFFKTMEIEVVKISSSSNDLLDDRNEIEEINAETQAINIRSVSNEDCSKYEGSSGLMLRTRDLTNRLKTFQKILEYVRLRAFMWLDMLASVVFFSEKCIYRRECTTMQVPSS